MQPLRSYYCQNYLALRDVSPFPELMQKLHIFNLENSMNNPSAMWSYKPQLCVLKPQSPIQPFVSDKTNIGYGCKPIGFRQFQMTLDSSKVDGDFALSTEQASGIAEITPTYYSYIEHSGSAGHGLAEFGGMFVPPSLHVGVLPVHSYSITPTDDDIQDITVIYKIDTLIEIEYSYDFVLPYDTRGNAHSLYTGDLGFINQHLNTVNAYGYKAHITIPTGTAGATGGMQPQQSTTAATPTTVTEYVRTRRSTVPTAQFVLPVLSPHVHRKKPKLTHDPIEEHPDFESFDRVRLSVCNIAPFSLPLSHDAYLSMSRHYKSLFINVNYKSLFDNVQVLSKVIRDYRLFGYLFNNCHTSDINRYDSKCCY